MWENQQEAVTRVQAREYSFPPPLLFCCKRKSQSIEKMYGTGLQLKKFQHSQFLPVTLSKSVEFSNSPFPLPQKNIKCGLNCLIALRSFLCLLLFCFVIQEATFLSQTCLPFGFQVDLANERQQQNITDHQWQEARTFLLVLAFCGILGLSFPLQLQQLLEGPDFWAVSPLPPLQTQG